LYGARAVIGFAMRIVAPIKYLLVFVFFVGSDVSVVVCALRALIVHE
jgi:hypothetical protein